MNIFIGRQVYNITASKLIIIIIIIIIYFISAENTAVYKE